MLLSHKHDVRCSICEKLSLIAIDKDVILFPEPTHVLIDRFGFVAVIGDQEIPTEEFEANVREALSDISTVRFFYFTDHLDQKNKIFFTTDQLVQVVSRSRFTHCDSAVKEAVVKNKPAIRKTNRFCEVMKLFPNLTRLGQEILCPHCKSGEMVKIFMPYRDKAKATPYYYRCGLCGVSSANLKEKIQSVNA